MPRLTIDLDPKVRKDLAKRAKSNYLSLTEQAEDIIRRSMLSYTRNRRRRPLKVDDALVGIFSRQRSGRKRKKKK